MPMDKTLSNKIERLGTSIFEKSDNLLNTRINKANYDKTLIGFVSDKIIKDNGTVQWEIQTEGAAYLIDDKKCNITALMQKVRLYLPNHNFREKYAEVITDYGITHPSKVVCDESGENSITITETWQLADMTEETRTYTLTVKDKGSVDEEVTSIIFPDNSVMELEGF